MAGYGGEWESGSNNGQSVHRSSSRKSNLWEEFGGGGLQLMDHISQPDSDWWITGLIGNNSDSMNWSFFNGAAWGSQNMILWWGWIIILPPELAARVMTGTCQLATIRAGSKGYYSKLPLFASRAGKFCLPVYKHTQCRCFVVYSMHTCSLYMPLQEHV